MIRTLIWKEYREQRPVWLALLILGFVTIVGLLEVLNPSELGEFNGKTNVIGVVATVVAFTYGMVCGAMLLAGEREGRTLAFLDSLEGRRLPIWGTKVVTGMVLALVMGLVLAGGVTGLGPHPRDPGFWFVIVPLFALVGIAWGLLGSALCGHVLTAVGVAALLIFAAFSCWLVLVQLIDGHRDRVIGLTWFWGNLGLTVAALVASGLIFCRPDWQRSPSVRASVQRTRRAKGFGLRAVLWLTYQQGRTAVLVLAAASLVLGAIIPDHALLLWPLATLLLGVCCGLGVFAGEQAGEGQRFLGDQRLPVGRIWAAKTVCWLFVLAVLATLMFFAGLLQLLAITVRTGVDRAGEQIVDRLIGPDWLIRDIVWHMGKWTFLTLGLAYGFAFGQFFGLLTRKTAVAAVLAVLVGLVVAGAWLPSLLAGGVFLWQVLLVPLLLVVAIRPVLWAWAGGRLHTLRPLAVLAGFGVLALAWMAGNFWLRAVQIPDVGQPFDVRAFAARLPPPEQNKAGELIRQAVASLAQYENEVNADLKAASEPKVAAPGKPSPRSPEYTEPRELLDKVLANGWTKGSAALVPWLNRMFQGQWAQELREAVRLPLGMIVDLRMARLDNDPYVEPCNKAAALFTARAYQLMAEGKHEAALEHLGIVLALSRQMRHKALSFSYHAGLYVQTRALLALQRWLHGLGAKPALVRSALTDLNQHAAQQPTLVDCIKAQYFVVDSNRDNPALLVRDKHDRAAPEMLLLAVASRGPWEAERETRLLHLMGSNALRLAESPLWEPPASPNVPRAGLLAYRRWGTSWRDMPRNLQWVWGWGLGYERVEPMRQAEGRSICQLGGTQLITALALYELEKGQPAATLDALVPAYLSAVPQDPYSGQPFRYRVSKGEKIERQVPVSMGQPFPEEVHVPAGQGIVWSAGPEGKDNGGTHDGSRVFTSDRPWSPVAGVMGGLNWVFLVPRWAAKNSKDN